MLSTRNTADPSRKTKAAAQPGQARTRAPGEGRARPFGDAGVKLDEEKKRSERSAPEPQHTAPTVGKTGGRGARAEKPSEGSDRKQASAPPSEVSRHGKPPAETPKATAKHGKPRAAAR